jgi:small subunit ribosomal protein S4
MARYRDARCKLCRREGEKLFLKGDKCFSSKCIFEKRKTPPGMHAAQRSSKPTDYAVRLRIKQKARRIYGILERQFAGYVEEATRMPGVTGENLMQLLERRLDNVVYRLGLASSRSQGRQLVRHGHFTVNGKVVSIPSYLCRVGDLIAIRPEHRTRVILMENVEIARDRGRTGWLDRAADGFSGRVVSFPSRVDIDTRVEEQLIIEYYSR